MKKLIFHFSILLFCFCIINAQFENLGSRVGIYGGTFDIKTNGHNILLSKTQNVFLSTDNGDNWKKILDMVERESYFYSTFIKDSLIIIDYFAKNYDDENYTYLCISYDLGKTWSSKKKCYNCKFSGFISYKDEFVFRDGFDFLLKANKTFEKVDTLIKLGEMVFYQLNDSCIFIDAELVNDNFDEGLQKTYDEFRNIIPIWSVRKKEKYPEIFKGCHGYNRFEVFGDTLLLCADCELRENSLFISIDNGYGWERKNDSAICGPFTLCGNILYGICARNKDGDILGMSTNFGSTWIPIFKSTDFIYQLKHNGNYLFLYCDEGTFRAKLKDCMIDTTYISDLEEVDAKDFSISPTLPSYTLSISVPPGSQNATIQIFSLPGELVYESTFFNDSSRQEIDVSQWLSGMYFAVIRCGDKVITEKVIVIRN